MGIAKCYQESFYCYIHLADNSSKFPPRSRTYVVSSGIYVLKHDDRIVFEKDFWKLGYHRSDACKVSAWCLCFQR